MSSSRTPDPSLAVTVRNIGGIDRTAVTLEPGLNVLAGRNATNRTSLLQAVMAALGSDRASLKGDSDEGRVTLDLGGDQYERSLTRTGDGVVFGGDPYLDDADAADLFAFLVESNEARQAVERGDDLREVLLRPVDTDALEAEIDRLQRDRRDVEAELTELDDLADRRRELRARRAELDAAVADLEERLAEARAALDGADTDIEASREDEAAFEAAMESLEDARSDLEDCRFELESNRESLASLREERDEVAEELAALPEPGDGGETADRIEALREEKAELEATLSDLGNLIRVNQEVLDGNDRLTRLLREESAAGDATGAGDVTAGLLPDGEPTVCWTCGSSAEPASFEATLDRLRSLADRLRTERGDLEDDIAELVAAREERERRERRRAELDDRLDRLDAEIAEREATVADLTDERADLVARVEDLEERVAALDAERYEEVLDRHREVTRLEAELADLEEERDGVAAEVDRITERLDERSALVAEREEIQSELEAARTRVERLEREAVEGFNDHMDELLDRLAYDNLERVWIERRGADSEGPTAGAASFDLHVVRSTADGVTYEDSVDHLSESERAVTGLVFALAGYLVHEVHADLPVVVLDSLEAIDADRIARLVDYFDDHADYVVVALLPEDAAALDDEYATIEEF
jgi:DNA repair exonuclease SbcCD ATPase subunit